MLNFLSNLDPTKTTKVGTKGIDETKAKLEGVNTDVLKKSISSQQIAEPKVDKAAQIKQPQAIETEQIRGTVAPVQAERAQPAQMTPAQIQALQSAQAASIVRDDEAFRQRQLALAQALEQQSMGMAPSVAQRQLQRANEQAIQQQMAVAASARGGSPILAQRQAAQNIAALQQEAAGKTAELALQEQAAARAQLGEVLSASRGQDIGVTTSQAQLAQQTELANKAAEDARRMQQAQLEQEAAKVNAMSMTDVAKFNAELATKAAQFNSDLDFRAAMSDSERALDAAKNNALNAINVDQFNAKAKDEMNRFKADSLLKTKIANQAADLQAKGMTLDATAKALGLEVQSLSAVLDAEKSVMAAKASAAEVGQARKAQLIGGLLQSGASVGAAALSDKTQKKNIEKGNKQIQNMLDVLSASMYDYKNPQKEGAAEGKRYGIMAQDLEKSDAGKSIVFEKNGSKMINVPQSVGVLLASVAHLNQEIKKLKGGK